MAHTAETYREAAKEHANLAVLLDEGGQHGAAHYWAGLAVECMLRAYVTRANRQFDSRHVLRNLVVEAAFYDVVRVEEVPAVTVAIETVAERWSNDHRYRPQRMVERWLRDKKLDRNISGDRMKYSSSRIVAAAWLIVETGETGWKRKS